MNNNDKSFNKVTHSLVLISVWLSSHFWAHPDDHQNVPGSLWAFSKDGRENTHNQVMKEALSFLGAQGKLHDLCFDMEMSDFEAPVYNYTILIVIVNDRLSIILL